MEVFTNRMVQAHGRTIGRICTVWNGAEYVGSYFERIVPGIPRGQTFNNGINARYLAERERQENDGPRETQPSWLDSIPKTVNSKF